MIQCCLSSPEKVTPSWTFTPIFQVDFKETWGLAVKLHSQELRLCYEAAILIQAWGVHQTKS